MSPTGKLQSIHIQSSTSEAPWQRRSTTPSVTRWGCQTWRECSFVRLLVLLPLLSFSLSPSVSLFVPVSLCLPMYVSLCLIRPPPQKSLWIPLCPPLFRAQLYFYIKHLGLVPPCVFPVVSVCGDDSHLSAGCSCVMPSTSSRFVPSSHCGLTLTGFMGDD